MKMNNNVKNFAIAALATGVALIFGGAWLNVTWVIAGGGLLLIGLLLLLHLLVNLKFAQTKIVKEQPITDIEKERGRKDLNSWLDSFISDGHGDKVMDLDVGSRQTPNEVMQELTSGSYLGDAFLDLYILNNRNKWREHYSEEDWATAKEKLIDVLSNMDSTKMDKPFLITGRDSYSPNQLIEAINAEDETGERQILMFLRFELYKANEK